MLPLDERAAALFATAASLVIAAASVLGCMTHGVYTTALYLAVALAALILFRFVLGKCLRAAIPAATTTDDTED